MSSLGTIRDVFLKAGMVGLSGDVSERCGW